MTRVDEFRGRKGVAPSRGQLRSATVVEVQEPAKAFTSKHGPMTAMACYDVRAADWPLGDALYKGPASLGPVVVDALALVLWLRLSLVRAAPARRLPGR
jgi:hypothetical protein